MKLLALGMLGAGCASDASDAWGGGAERGHGGRRLRPIEWAQVDGTYHAVAR